ncbi:MAG: hypothetical protein AB7V50_09160 [Vampirovibrionia bacterium]
MYVQPYKMNISAKSAMPAFKGEEFERRDNIQTSSSSRVYENPVSRTGEYFIALNDSYKKSLKISARTFLEIARVGCVSSDDAGCDFAIMTLIGVGVGLAVLLYNLPKNLYEANVNFFTRSKEMDVFVRNNSAEKTIYEKLDSKLDNSDTEETKDIYEQFMKVKTAHIEPNKILLLA